MSPRPMVAGFLIFSMIVSGPASAWRADAQSPPPAPAPPPNPAGAPAPRQAPEVTPPRVSYIHGEVSFWRPGAEEWTPAKLNTPLAPGDVLYTGPGGNVELQIGPRGFLRAAESTQLGLDNHEPDFLQFRVTGGYAALDLREVPTGHTLELDTPNAAFTVERPGYYRLDVARDSTTFATHRGGVATMTPAGGTATPIAANQQLVVTGTDSPSLETAAAPELTAWDRWNYQRTAYLLHPTSTTQVPAGVYSAEALDQYGSWRTAETYGSVWVPASVPVGWVPYSTGRWIWDPRFGWTWLDDAPWGWAPYHYGRWVFIGSYWAWAPGPVVVRPVYSPALVVFLGGGVRVGIGVRPLCWAPLAWGEPLIPWWGRPGFIGVASWRGWGGPRVVNNVVVNRTTTVNVTDITVYRNVTVKNAVVGVSADRFGRHHERPRRIADADVRRLTPVRGDVDVRPVPASVTVSAGVAARPPAAFQARATVATRRPHDTAASLHAHGIATTQAPESAPAPRIVPSPRSERATKRAAVPQHDGSGGAPSAARPGRERGQQGPPTPPPQRPASLQREPAPGQQQGAPPPQLQAVPSPSPRVERQARGEHVDRGERRERGQQQAAPIPQRQSAPSQPPALPQQPSPTRAEPVPNRSERLDRGDRQDRGARPERGEPQRRAERQQPAERQ